MSLKSIREKALAAGLMFGASSIALAASFQVQEQNVTNLGTAYSGTAALAEDASTGFYNSAGLTFLTHDQAVVSAVGIFPHGKFEVASATATTGPALGSGTEKPKGNALIPGLHVAYRVAEDWSLGLNIVSPFGLKTKYSQTGITRYMATRSELRTIDIAPSVAYQVNEKASIGIGPDFVHVKAWLDTQIGAGAISTDGFQKNKGTDWAYGWHLGAMYQVTDATRIGLNYRSKLDVKLDADSHQEFPLGTVSNRTVKADVTLPETIVFSAHHQFDDQWAMMTDVQWVRWDRFKELKLRFSDNTSLTTEENYKNTFRVAVGGTYQYDDCWKFRGGVAFDQSPTKEAYRTTRIPDSDRWWLGVGAQYRWTENVNIDVGYAHLFFKDSKINESAPKNAAGAPSGLQTIQGDYKASADILGIQFTWNFV